MEWNNELPNTINLAGQSILTRHIVLGNSKLRGITKCDVRDNGKGTGLAHRFNFNNSRPGINRDDVLLFKIVS